MSDIYWDWPEWKDPEAWDDIEVVRVWREVLADRLVGLPVRTMRQVYDDVLKRFYYGPMVAQLNDTTPLLRKLEWLESDPSLPRYVPPKWHIRKYRRLKRRVWDVRVAVGFWIAAHHPEDD